MINHDVIADKIEQAVTNLFATFNPENTGLTEYSIFFNPQKSNTWFVVFFFENGDELKENLGNGVCYQLRSDLLKQLNETENLSKLELVISFEQGNRPIEESEYEGFYDILLAKLEVQKNASGKGYTSICGCCQHDFDNHQLMSNIKENNATPSEGWIICSEENCYCFQTWSAEFTPNI